ncbi:hypothetical protein QQS21_006809 [Conoideocrella luteorostrata]|uniref:Acyl-CoA dehydrogenase n=1 Tax=Conoideocrella luteorostrata TaxID=1105319 RepID=A0AAJ0FXM5_9HYPO|nr:hypothetical protein QQS21_006809 [Conoideocrella luteorostrata]
MVATQSSPASADTGFIFSMPPAENRFTEDVFFRRLLAWYLPSDMCAKIEPEFTAFAEETASEQVKEWLLSAEREPPYVKSHNKRVRAWGAANGAVAIGYETEYGSYRRIVQHAKNYFFTPVSAVTSCPLSMSDGAAHLLLEVLPGLPLSHPFHEVFRRLTSRTDCWTSGQWMTERSGGSDVQNTETWAVYSPLPNKTGECGKLDEGDYLVSGFKFFSSATDANVAILLAKTAGGKLSAFLAPLTRTVLDENGREKTVTNGIRIHRLKNKLGTKQLPTAELELKDVRAHLVGPLDRGVGTISHILNVTRAWAFIGSLAGMRRCMNIAKSFAKARTVFGYPLWILPLHLRTLAGLEVRIRGLLHLGFYTLALTSFAESTFPKAVLESSSYAPLPSSAEDTVVILRTLTAVTKAVVSKTAVTAIQECMEALGGVGYMDELDEPENIARALRDISVNAIWEGTTNVLSSEVIRHLLNKHHLDIFNNWLRSAIARVKIDDLRSVLQDAWAVQYRLLSKQREYLFDALANGRAIMFTIAWTVSGTLLAIDAGRDGNPVAGEVARRWIINQEGFPREYLLADMDATLPSRRPQEGKERAEWDCMIVWDAKLPEFVPFGQRTGVQQPSKI